MKCAVLTFGCKANQADSDAMLDDLVAAGHEVVDTTDEAELILINSCTVTQRTDHDVRKTVRRIHRRNPNGRIIFMGCYAQRAPSDLGPEDGVRMVVGNTFRNQLTRLVEQANPEAQDVHWSAYSDTGDLKHVASAWRRHSRPFVKIQDGCNARCAYCIIPHVRGPSRSARPEMVIDRIRSLVQDGANEVVLTGIHLGSYGMTFTPAFTLSRLVSRILKESDIARIRLSSIEPMEFDEGLVTLLAQEPRMAPHLHIPLQSGSEEVLGRMNRPYTPAQYARLVKRLARAREGLALGADVIVGFPGETDAEFSETCRFIEDLPLTYLHVFPFSPRAGTPAAGMKDRLSPEAVKDRGGQLRRTGFLKSLAFKRSLTGKSLWALSLKNTVSPSSTHLLTENYIYVEIPGIALPQNRPVVVTIDRVTDDGKCVGSFHPSSLSQEGGTA